MTVKVWTTTKSNLVKWAIRRPGPTLTLVLNDGSAIEFDPDGISQLHEVAQKILDENAQIEDEIEDHARDINEWLDKSVRQ